MLAKTVVLQMAGLLTATTALALAVNAFSPVGLSVTRALTLRELDARYITAEETKARHDAGQSLFVDARRPEVFAKGHIAGAQNLPTDEFGERFATMAGWLPKEAELVIYCDMKSCALSRQLADKLKEAGYERVVIFRDGWAAWKNCGWAAE
jgi:rhodanese-related sulfurtransferase